MEGSVDENRLASPGESPSQPAFMPVQVGLLQRKCACGGSAGLGGQCDECQTKKLFGLQTKLKVNEPGDIYEQEADRIADQVLAAPAHPAVSGVPPRIQRFSGQSNGQMDTAPASVDHALASPGRPLEPALRQDMEQRFGHDFSQVRVHSGAAAEQSARDVNANAYTVGHTSCLAAGRFAPGTHEGRRLIAHELTHVVQQSHGAQQVQRWASCEPARLSLEDCPPREAGEKESARSKGMAFLPGLSDPISGAQGAAIVNFDIGKSSIKANLHGQILWKEFLQKIAKNRSRWKLVGFTDCHGDDGLNERLRAERAKAVFDILPNTLQPQITSHEGAPAYDCITANSSAPDRAMNRSVALILDYSVADLTAEEVTGCIPPQGPSTGGKTCKFFVYDSTEQTHMGKLWKAAAYADAAFRPATYVIPSGDSIEEMLEGILVTYAMKDCDCTDELQFWSHGSSGNGMWISGGKGEFTVKSFNIPGLGKFGDGPVNMPGYRQWADALSTEQRRLVVLRRTICGPDSEVYYRSCQAFQGKAGQEFAEASANFWRSEVLGHTKLIGLTQPGKRSLKPCQEPYWSISEGVEEEGKKGKVHEKPK